MHKRIDIVSVCYWICVSTNGHTYLPITWNMIIWETKEQVKLITKFSLVVMCSSFYVYCALRATILTTALFQLKVLFVVNPFLVLCEIIQPTSSQVQVLPSEWHLLSGSGWLPSQTSESVPAGSWAGRAAQTTVQLEQRTGFEGIQGESKPALYLLHLHHLT